MCEASLNGRWAAMFTDLLWEMRETSKSENAEPTTLALPNPDHVHNLATGTAYSSLPNPTTVSPV